MMEIETHETREDVEAFMAEHLKGPGGFSKTRRQILILAVSLLAGGVMIMVFFTLTGTEFYLNPVVIAFLAVLILFPFYLVAKYFLFFDSFSKKIARNTLKNRNIDSYLGRGKIVIDGKGVHRYNRYREEHFRWEGIRKVVDIRDHILIYDTDVSALIVPKRSFSSKEQVKEFLDKIEELKGGVENTP